MANEASDGLKFYAPRGGCRNLLFRRLAGVGKAYTAALGLTNPNSGVMKHSAAIWWAGIGAD
jgi:hypothetical protein